MPASVVKSARDEGLWEKAKAIVRARKDYAELSGGAFYALVNAIYQRMKGQPMTKGGTDSAIAAAARAIHRTHPGWTVRDHRAAIAYHRAEERKNLAAGKVEVANANSDAAISHMLAIAVPPAGGWPKESGYEEMTRAEKIRMLRAGGKVGFEKASDDEIARAVEALHERMEKERAKYGGADDATQAKRSGPMAKSVVLLKSLTGGLRAAKTVVLLKGGKVKAPGSRGGRFHLSKTGDVVYGETSSGKKIGHPSETVTAARSAFGGTSHIKMHQNHPGWTEQDHRDAVSHHDAQSKAHREAGNRDLAGAHSSAALAHTIAAGNPAPPPEPRRVRTLSPAAQRLADRKEKEMRERVHGEVLTEKGIPPAWLAGATAANQRAGMDPKQAHAEAIRHWHEQGRMAEEAERKREDGPQEWHNQMTAHEKLSAINQALDTGKVVYVQTATKATRVTAKHRQQWEKAGRPLFKLSDGKLLMASGKGYVSIDYTNLMARAE